MPYSRTRASIQRSVWASCSQAYLRCKLVQLDPWAAPLTRPLKGNKRPKRSHRGAPIYCTVYFGCLGIHGTSRPLLVYISQTFSDKALILKKEERKKKLCNKMGWLQEKKKLSTLPTQWQTYMLSPKIMHTSTDVNHKTYKNLQY